MAEKQTVAEKAAAPPDPGPKPESEAEASKEQAEELVPIGDRVRVKPDGRGGYTVEKFGGSVHFTEVQWANLQDAVDEADAQAEEDRKALEAEAKAAEEREKASTASDGKTK